jgi:hypothetical protein
MRFENIKRLNDKEFRRLTGVKRKTFEEMIVILRLEEEKKLSNGGRKPSIVIEDQILMMLEYLREYRTYFHISQSYNLSESACFRIIKWVENTLIRSRKFSLPGKKALLKAENEFEVILIDVTESPIERPKKNKKNTTLAKRNGTR